MFKYLIGLVSLILFLSGCAEGPKELGKQLGCVFKGTACDSRDGDINDLRSRVSSLEKDMVSVKNQGAYLQSYSDSLQSQINTSNALISVLQSQVVVLQSNSSANASSIAILQSQVAALQGQVVSLNSTTITVNNSIVILQSQAATTLVQLAILNGYDHIVSLIDPCGDTPNKFDEVFIRLSNNKIISSFSDTAGGLNTRFSILVDGSFNTTDGTSCSFSVSSTGTIVTPSVEY